MKTDNELIAEFMGLQPNPHDGGRTWGDEVIELNGHLYSPEWTTLKYHESWDWLMPVVEKIYEKYLQDTNQVGKYEHYRKVIDLAVIANIGAVYNRVVEFIKWYNNP